ncbi:MAG TPA: FAD-dependent oxidoreductase, partial [Usitatibacter sp.]|nr:FAD-dependent oxidoreductase [Usitatibacter sp.]
TRRNIQQIVALSLYSRATLQQLRAETGIHYDELARGILHYYTEEREFEQAVKAASLMRKYGLDREVESIDEAIRIEPALASARAKIVGATYTASDESGDAYLFTSNLARLAATKGVVFRFGHQVRAIRPAGVRVGDVRVTNPQGVDEAIDADAYVVALGSYSPLLTRPIGINLPIYPAKGYSATVDVAQESHAPQVSLTDDEAKIVITRLGSRLRIAGTAELTGYSTELNMVRCEALIRRAREMFPQAGVWDRPLYWTGLRPSTPSNVPLIGRTRYCNLFLNTGHGTLGWTMGAGSGKALADIISERRPEVDFQFTEDGPAQ